jgi:ABC-2 type transport system permease protein
MGTVNWLGLWTLYQKEVERFLKVGMQAVVAPMVTALLFLTVFTLAFGARRAGMTGGVPFAVFLAPGLIMMQVIQNSFANTASSILISKVQGNIVDVLMPPLSATELAVAYALSGLTRGLVCATAVFLAMWPFVPFSFYALWPALFFVCAAGLLLSQVGVLTGLWADKFDHLSAVTNFVITPLAFLSGTFYSIEQLPPAFRAIGHLNPFFYMIDGFRFTFIGRAEGSLLAGVLLLSALNATLFALSLLAFHRGWHLKA